MLAAMALGLGTLTACRVSDILDGGRACTAEFRFGIVVRVVDSVSSADAAAGATVVIRDGAYVDSLPAPPDQSFPGASFAGAGERAGTYTVTVTKAGYRPWARNGVVVTRNECHVNTVQLEARLQPAS